MRREDEKTWCILQTTAEIDLRCEGGGMLEKMEKKMNSHFCTRMQMQRLAKPLMPEQKGIMLWGRFICIS